MLIQNVSGKGGMSGWGSVDSLSPAPPPTAKPSVLSNTLVDSALQSERVVDKASDPASNVEPTPGELRDAVNKINHSMKEINSNLQFSIDSDTQRIVVKVVESKTGEVIKQFPSEEALAIAKAIDQFQKSLLVKQSA